MIYCVWQVYVYTNYLTLSDVRVSLFAILKITSITLIYSLHTYKNTSVMKLSTIWFTKHCYLCGWKQITSVRRVQQPGEAAGGSWRQTFASCARVRYRFKLTLGKDFKYGDHAASRSWRRSAAVFDVSCYAFICSVGRYLAYPSAGPSSTLTTLNA